MAYSEEPRWSKQKLERKASALNSPITGGQDILPSPLAPSNLPLATFRIYACFSAAGTLTLRRTRSGGTVGEVLNISEGLMGAGGAYIFEVIVEEGDTINLRYSVTCTCIRLIVGEVAVVTS